MKRFFYIILLLVIHSFPAGSAQAAESQAELVAQMNALIEMGRYQEAYVLGQTGLFDYEGEANF